MSPAEKLFSVDLASAAYQSGAAAGRWGVADYSLLPKETGWPKACFWLKAAVRCGAPDRYYIMIDVTGYRSESPTGSFWDPTNKTMLAAAKYPKGKPGSRFAQVFRTDWGPGVSKAFYHYFDRFTLSSHPDWRNSPHLLWTERHTIVDYLDEFQTLLMGDDYLGQ